MLKRRLDGAAKRLATQECAALLLGFRDVHGRPLADRLDELRVDAPTYLSLVLFRDGSSSEACRVKRTFAFTAPGDRVVFLCARFVEDMWKGNPKETEVVLIHEMLHSLGLGENPPTSAEITRRVTKSCGS
jgi:hypothetical protein